MVVVENLEQRLGWVSLSTERRAQRQRMPRSEGFQEHDQTYFEGTGCLRREKDEINLTEEIIKRRWLHRCYR